MESIPPEHIKTWNRGEHSAAYRLLGAHLSEDGAVFSVWAPHAQKVSVVGDFNSWNGDRHPMEMDEDTGIWRIFIPGIMHGSLYKYQITGQSSSKPFLKTDPYARSMELRPDNASRVYREEEYQWTDQQWMSRREDLQGKNSPVSIYEVHAGSWRHRDGQPLSYRELADELIPYVQSCGFTHIELMPLAEYPHDPSWGYQITGFFAPTSRYGEPSEFKYFVNQCHKHNVGVIMDWVPGHFPKDEHGLRRFDGTPLYENSDPKNREQKDWGTYSFDYGKAGVRNFLLSNACYWCDRFHIDGLRVDAVASMLYLDYSRGPGEWTPNKYGGKENLEAISLLRDVTTTVHRKYPGVNLFAEESTSWPKVTDPVEEDGLGFDFKWNMGWMNDTLSYMQKGEDERRADSHKVTFPMMYNSSEQFVLPLSHDEVVHLKKPLLKKSPGTSGEQLANLRLLYTYMFGHPGKKLLFMGSELAVKQEWSEQRQLDWQLLQDSSHRGVQRLIHDLNKLYSFEPALYELDRLQAGFEWIELGDTIPGLFSFLRKPEDPADHLLFALNFSASPVSSCSLNPFQGLQYRLIFNSDSEYYGGRNRGSHLGRGDRQHITMPEYSGLILKPAGRQ